MRVGTLLLAFQCPVNPGKWALGTEENDWKPREPRLPHCWGPSGCRDCCDTECLLTEVWEVFSGQLTLANFTRFPNFMWLYHYLPIRRNMLSRMHRAPCLKKIFLGERPMKGALRTPGKEKERPSRATWGSNCKSTFRSVSVQKLLTRTWCFVPKLIHYFLHKWIILKKYLWHYCLCFLIFQWTKHTK